MGYIWTVALGRAPRLPGTKTKGAILPKCWLIRVCPTIESCCGVTQYVTDPKTLLFPFIDFPILRPIDSAPSYLIQNYFICLLNFFTLKIHSVNFCFYWAAYSRGEGGVKAKGPQLELNLWHRVYMQHILKLLAWHCSLFSGSAYLRCSSKWKGAVCVQKNNRKNKRSSVSHNAVSPRNLFMKYFNRSQFPVKCHYSVSAHTHASQSATINWTSFPGDNFRLLGRL